jgi:dihydrofolate reductase
MRKLRIMEQISLDSVIQQSADENDFPYGAWTTPYRTPAGRDAILAAYGASYDLLLGRRTYDMWSGFWPKAPSSPMADRLNAATKYVVTHHPESLAWGPFEGLGPDFVEEIRRIKAQDGSDLILSGSSTLTSPLLEHGLADEVSLVVFPVLLGTGKRILQREPRRAHSSSSARKLWHRASSSTPTGPTDLCGPAPWAPRCKPTSESMGKREDSNEKANLRNQHYLGWLRRPHQTICR